MEKINRAYFCLEDDDRRRRYDAYGEKAVGTSASSEKKMKENADAYFGDDSNNNRRRSSGDVSPNSAPESYRVEDDPFVWENFRREQAEKRERHSERYSGTVTMVATRSLSPREVGTTVGRN